MRLVDEHLRVPRRRGTPRRRKRLRGGGCGKTEEQQCREQPVHICPLLSPVYRGKAEALPYSRALRQRRGRGKAKALPYRRAADRQGKALPYSWTRKPLPTALKN